ncbi:MAG: lysine 2,3-aminomutase [Phycisphaerales bacterium]|nr:lysine 2,3-aminomutase [Phycisphaerales bacterium]MCB9855454.1 lysine 2,3-aminomutase [Phycisphaerales bacterium]MCB9864230.1 lysine 2,3-aminomutase [Phycisphaerales bacterium]
MFQHFDPNEAERFKPITRANVARTPYWNRLSPDLQEAVNVVSAVLPFRSNEYVARELIDWDRVPHDPIFQLTFPQKGMLREDNYETIASLIRANAPHDEVELAADRIRLQLNPHPAGQLTHNVPKHHGCAVPGVQHKYRETCLFFPSNGQTCHAYCTFCFRWAQFIGHDDLKFASHEADTLVEYLREHRWVTDILFTGGDPMIMGTKVLRRYIEALLHPDLEHVQTIRIGTKAVAYWPQRFVTDPDADALMTLFDRVVAAGKHLAVMGHYSHPVELSTDISQEAVRRIRSTGANIRMQSPLIRHVNDDATTWADLWRTGVRLGAIPYYMFVERDTGARRYFEVPLVKAWDIFRKAYSRVSGLARTVRGPSMSATPGKVHILGVSEIGDERVFVLEYLQARDASLVRRPFFACFDPTASWFDQLVPFSERDKQFFPDADDSEFGEESRPVPLRVSPGLSATSRP